MQQLEFLLEPGSSRFEVKNTGAAHMQEQPSVHQALQLTVDGVKRVFTKINPRKAAGPDHIPGCVLKGCAEQLKDVFCDIFNISLSQASVPTCLKALLLFHFQKSPIHPQ